MESPFFSKMSKPKKEKLKKKLKKPKKSKRAQIELCTKSTKSMALITKPFIIINYNYIFVITYCGPFLFFFFPHLNLWAYHNTTSTYQTPNPWVCTKNGVTKGGQPLISSSSFPSQSVSCCLHVHLFNIHRDLAHLRATSSRS